jgi:V-type H+-transporting ATPase subunit a
MEAINMKNLDRNKTKEIMGGQIRPYKNTEDKPPTYFKLNQFTYVFQLIVNIYGVPRYKEINPGLFTIITFPFLFAVMFGDMFHGSLLLAFAAYLTLGYNYILKSKSGLSAMLPYRYLVLLMGMFAVFTGMIYNDFTSIRMNFYGSCYEVDDKNNTAIKQDNCTYSFGLDPVWSISTEEIAFSNSLKMKMAVILGVT